MMRPQSAYFYIDKLQVNNQLNFITSQLNGRVKALQEFYRAVPSPAQILAKSLSLSYKKFKKFNRLSIVVNTCNLAKGVPLKMVINSHFRFSKSVECSEHSYKTLCGYLNSNWMASLAGPGFKTKEEHLNIKMLQLCYCM